MPEKLTQKLSTPSKIEKILVGSWNAAKPESQGKTILEIYDALKFPQFTKEEKKVTDTLHVFLKEHPELVGWGAIVGEAALLAGIVGGLRKIHERKNLTPAKIRPGDVWPGTLILKKDSLPPWEDGVEQIAGHIHQQIERLRQTPGYWLWPSDEKVRNAARVLSIACRAVGNTKNEAEMTELAWNAGVIGSFLVAPWINGQLKEVGDLAGAGNGKGALEKLQERVASYMGDTLGKNPRIMMNFWGSTFRFAGLNFVLQKRQSASQWTHMSEKDPRLPGMMQVVHEAFMKNR